jgi:trimethylamine--corrinoid protein Co-methyltransferase
MGSFYGLPSRGGGLITDAKVPDAQMGAEKMLNCLTASLAGLNTLAGAGAVDFINTINPMQMLIDHEIIRVVKHMLRGFEVNSSSIALDVIREVGHGGTYLTHDHTVEKFRQELWFPELWDRKGWSVWEEEGSADVSARARASLLEFNHSVPAFDAQVEQRIWEIVERADCRLT